MKIEPVSPDASGTDPIPGITRLVVLTLFVPLLLTAGGVAIALAIMPELPDPVATHWGPDGVDGTGSAWSMIVVMAAITVVLALMFTFLATFWGKSSSTRRFSAGLSVGLAVFMIGVSVATLWVQRDVVVAADVGDIQLPILVCALVALAAGILAAVAVVGDPPRPTSQPVPADAPHLQLAPGEVVTWTRLMGGDLWRWISLTVAIVGGALGIAIGQWWLILAIVVPVELLVTMLSWRVIVDARGLTCRAMLGFPRMIIPLNEVERADVVDISPLRDFGGWGYRVGRGGRIGIVLRSGEAVEVERSGGRVVAVTVDDASTGASLLNALAARGRP